MICIIEDDCSVPVKMKKLYFILLHLLAIFGFISFMLSVANSLNLSECHSVFGQVIYSLDSSKSAYARFQSCKKEPSVMEVWMRI